MVPLLVARGADINQPLDWGDKGKLTVKELALQAGDTALAQYLDGLHTKN